MKRVRTHWALAAICLFAIACGGTDTRSAADDLQFFADFVEAAHPAPFRYATESEWDAAIAEERLALESLPADPLDRQLAVGRSLHRVAALLGDFHVMVALPMYGDADADVQLFPLPLFAVQGRLAVDAEVQGIPVGATVSAIDGQPLADVLETLRPLVAADGRDPNAVDAELAAEFSRFYAIGFGFSDSYVVDVRMPDGTRTEQTVLAASRDAFAEAVQARRSTAIVDGDTPTQTTLTNVNDQTARLRLPGFAAPQLDDALDDMRALVAGIDDDIDHLIVDVRGNRGGFRTLGFPLLDHVLDAPYPQRSAVEVRVRSIPREFRDAVEPLFPGSVEQLVERFPGDGPPYRTEGDEAEPLMAPTGTWQGAITILTDGLTNSAANALALTLAVHHPTVRVVGSPPGGACDEHVGDVPVLLELPAADARVLVSLVRIHHAAPEGCRPGAGLPMDVAVEWTVEDLVEGRDPGLAAAVR